MRWRAASRPPPGPLTPACLPDHLPRRRIHRPGGRFARRCRLRRGAATSRRRLGRIATLTVGSAVSRRSSGRHAGSPSRLLGCLGPVLRAPRAVVFPPPPAHTCGPLPPLPPPTPAGLLHPPPTQTRGPLPPLAPPTPAGLLHPPPTQTRGPLPPLAPPTPAGLPPLTFPADARQGRARSREDVKDGTPAGGRVLRGGGEPPPLIGCGLPAGRTPHQRDGWRAKVARLHCDGITSASGTLSPRRSGRRARRRGVATAGCEAAGVPQRTPSPIPRRRRRRHRAGGRDRRRGGGRRARRHEHCVC